MLKPINGYVLIELVDKYRYASTPEGQYDTKTSGYVRSISGVTGDGNLVSDKLVWFESYKDDTKIERDDKTYTFVKFEEIKGFEQD